MKKRGRPPGKKTDWVSLGSYVSPESAEYLAEMKKRGYIKSRIVDAGILLHKIQGGIKK